MSKLYLLNKNISAIKHISFSLSLSLCARACACACVYKGEGGGVGGMKGSGVEA